MTKKDRKEIKEEARRFIEGMQRLEGGSMKAPSAEVERAVKDTALAFGRFARATFKHASSDAGQRRGIMDDSTKPSTSEDQDDRILQLFETMQLSTPEQRTLIREQGRRLKKKESHETYSMRLSYSSGPATAKD